MKKIFITLIFIFSLASCFGGEKSEDGLIPYDDSKNFSIRIPQKWEIIENKDGIIPTPRTGKIELAVTSKEKINDFYNNLLIGSEVLEKNISNTDYFNSVTLNNKKDYFDYKSIENKDIVFIDGRKSSLLIFEAKYDISTPKIKYLQTVSVCSDKNAYFITLAIPTDIESTKNYEYMLSSFSCKN